MNAYRHKSLPDSPDSVLEWVRAIALGLAKKYQFPKDLLEDLVSEGLVRYYEVLVDVKSQNPSAKSYYMFLHVRGRMLDSLSRVIQIPVASNYVQQKIEPVADARWKSEEPEKQTGGEEIQSKPEESLDAKRDLERVRKLAAGFSPLARALVFEPYLSGKSLEEIATRYGISKSTASRRRKKIVSDLRKELRGVSLSTPLISHPEQKVSRVKTIEPLRERYEEELMPHSKLEAGDSMEEGLRFLYRELKEAYYHLGRVVSGMAGLFPDVEQSAVQKKTSEDGLTGLQRGKSLEN